MRRARLALFGFVVFLSVLVGLADAGRGQWLFGLAGLVPGGDKAGHFILFGVLSLLVNITMRAAVLRYGKLTVLKGSAIIMAFVIAEEVSQLFFVSRSFDFLDLGADLVGIWTFGQLARRYLRYENALALQSAASPQRNR
jgi:polysaccharide biosynthesis protein VpsQ